MKNDIKFYGILGGAGHGKGTLLKVFKKFNDKKILNVSYSTTMKNQVKDIFITDKEREIYPNLNDLEILNELKDNNQNYKIFKDLNMRELLQKIGTEFYRSLGKDIHIKYEAEKILNILKEKEDDFIIISDDTRFENELKFIMEFNKEEDKVDYIKYFLDKDNNLPSNKDFLNKMIDVLNLDINDKKEIIIVKNFINRISVDVEKLRKKQNFKNEYEEYDLFDLKSMSVEEAYKKNIISVFRPIVHPEIVRLSEETLEEEIEKYTKLPKEEVISIKKNYEKSKIEWNLKNVKKYGYARSNISHSSERELDIYKPEEVIVEPIKNKKEEALYIKKIERLIKDNKWVSTIDKNHNNHLIISFSAGSLFDMKDAEDIFKKNGIRAYRNYLKDMEDNNEIFGPGPALGLYNSFKNLSKMIDEDLLKIDFVLITRVPVNLRAFWSSYEYYIDDIDEFNRISCGNEHSADLNVSFGVDLAITTSKETAELLHEKNVSSLYIPNISKENNEELYKRKDGGVFLISDFDGVISDSKSERIYQEAKKRGDRNPIDTFSSYELENSEIPMELGPIGKVIKKLSIIIEENQNYKLENNTTENKYPFDSTIITARGGEVRKRFLNTLMAHNISVGSFHMMSGINKNNPLNTLKSKVKDMNLLFIDDGEIHFERSKEISSVISGYVVNDYNYEESRKIKEKRKKKKIGLKKH